MQQWEWQAGQASTNLNGNDLCHVVEAGDAQSHRRLPLHLRRSPLHQQADQVLHQRRRQGRLQTLSILGQVAKNLDNVLGYYLLFGVTLSAAAARLQQGWGLSHVEDNPCPGFATIYPRKTCWSFESGVRSNDQNTARERIPLLLPPKQAPG